METTKWPKAADSALQTFWRARLSNENFWIFEASISRTRHPKKFNFLYLISSKECEYEVWKTRMQTIIHWLDRLTMIKWHRFTASREPGAVATKRNIDTCLLPSVGNKRDIYIIIHQGQGWNAQWYSCEGPLYSLSFYTLVCRIMCAETRIQSSLSLSLSLSLSMSMCIYKPDDSRTLGVRIRSFNQPMIA